MLEAGEAGVEQIDRAVQSAGYPMGPFALMDLVGVDVNLAVATALCGQASTRPCGSSRRRSSATWSSAGQSGPQDGRGFYRYEDGQPAGLSLDCRHGLAGTPRRLTMIKSCGGSSSRSSTRPTTRPARASPTRRHRPRHEARREPPVRSVRACRPAGPARGRRGSARLELRYGERFRVAPSLWQVASIC